MSMSRRYLHTWAGHTGFSEVTCLIHLIIPWLTGSVSLRWVLTEYFFLLITVHAGVSIRTVQLDNDVLCAVVPPAPEMKRTMKKALELDIHFIFMPLQNERSTHRGRCCAVPWAPCVRMSQSSEWCPYCRLCSLPMYFPKKMFQSHFRDKLILSE